MKITTLFLTVINVTKLVHCFNVASLAVANALNHYSFDTNYSILEDEQRELDKYLSSIDELPCGKFCLPGDLSCKFESPSATSRIIGGNKTQDQEIPWQVSLRIKDGTHQCGGNIINKNWILTAAHCLRDERLFVATGWKFGKGKRISSKIRLTGTASDLSIRDRSMEKTLFLRFKVKGKFMKIFLTLLTL